MRSRLALAVFAVALAGCSTNSPAPLDGGDGGGTDSGTPHEDAGFDAGLPNPDVKCSVSAQDCDAGSCMLSALPDGGLGARCFEGECDLVRQDCDAGQKCTYVTDGGPSFARGCAPEGSADEGAPCTGTPSSNTCKRGLICALRELADGGTASLCAKFCTDSVGCPSPQQCYVIVTVSGTEERPLVCGAPPPSCDLLTQDCAKSTDGCYPQQPAPACFPAGASTPGTSCTYSNDCEKGTACIRTGTDPGVCRQLCQYPSGAPECPTGTSCRQLQNHAGVGACLPQ